MRQQKRSSTCAGDEILFGVAQDIGHCITTRVFSLQSINLSYERSKLAQKRRVCESGLGFTVTRSIVT